MVEIKNVALFRKRNQPQSFETVGTAATLTPPEGAARTAAAYAVATPLNGGGVAEWLKAAVC
jgi:hypothetical protein